MLTHSNPLWECKHVHADKQWVFWRAVSIFFLIYSFLQRKRLFAEIKLVYGAQIFLFEKKIMKSFYPFNFKSLFRLQNVNKYCIHGETLCNDHNYFLNLYENTKLCKCIDRMMVYKSFRNVWEDKGPFSTF